MENGLPLKDMVRLRFTFKLKQHFLYRKCCFNAQELVTTHLAVESYNWVEWLVLLERRSD